MVWNEITREVHRVLLLILLLSIHGMAYAQSVPPHNDAFGRFIDPVRTMGCADDSACYKEADRYLQDIGVYDPGTTTPNANRGTTRAWKQSHGFSLDPTNPNPGELRVVYWNAGDLGLGRDMHCINNTTNAHSFVPLERKTFACYVTNYRVNVPGTEVNGNPFTGTPDIEASIANAARNTNPVATVAMEVSHLFFRGINLLASRGNVNFIAFDEIRNGVPFSPPLDTNVGVRSELPRHSGKASPGTCLACHGGTYQPRPADATSGAKVVNGNFLPFNTAASNFVFTIDPTLSQFSEIAQRETFRKMNEFVVATQPAAIIISDLIKGWYGWCGGVSASGCYIDDISHPFIPDAAAFNNPCATTGPGLETQTCGWANPSEKPKDLSRAVYQQVADVYCRTCHVALPERRNVQQFNDWVRGSTRSAVDSHRMPFAEVPYNNYWRDIDAQGLYDKFVRYSASCVADCRATANQCKSRCRSEEAMCLRDLREAHGGQNTPEDRRQCAEERRLCTDQCRAEESSCINTCR